jgi:8-oxo-dGTP pyrophosphatase MutT (NUDIX family)
MTSSIDLTAFLHWIDAHNAFDLHNYLDFVIEDTVVGAVHRHRWPLLQERPGVFHVDDTRVTLNPRLDTPAARTEALAGVLCEWRNAGLFPGWRDELYRVSAGFDVPPLMALERAAASTFGILRYGAHLNGVVRKNGRLHLWIARRALTKPEHPGKLDHIVAGGIPAGLSAWDVVIKECQEEANIPPELVQHARPVSLISYMIDVNFRRHRDLIFIYDLELPEAFIPQNTDGEVAEFYLWPIEQVIEIMTTTEDFKMNNNLVIIDFLLRHGYVGPDDPHYAAIAQRLRSSVMW